MGCGTGLVGEALHARGYKQIVGVDASQGMLDVAGKKGAYVELKPLFLGTPDKFPQEYRDRFAAIAASGILAEGHLGKEVFDEMLIAMKAGGVAVFTTRTEYLEKFGYGKRMSELESEGKWKKLKEVTFTRYDQLKDQSVGRYRAVEVKAFAYQKS